MSALETALAELRRSVTRGTTAALSADQCAALVGHIDWLATVLATARMVATEAVTDDAAALRTALLAILDRQTAAEPTEEAPGEEIPAVRGYRVGDLVKITGRGELLDGRTGPVAELDDDPEFGIGIKVDGFLDLVWCNSGEIRHLDAAEVAAGEAGAR